MDRLHAVRHTLGTGGPLVALVVALLWPAFGCTKDNGSSTENREAVAGARVNAVRGVAKAEVTVEEFCDVRPKDEAGAVPMSWPPLAEGQSAPTSKSWQWINVWATWCAPCIEEMPKLMEWQRASQSEGTAFDLVFVSADETDDLVTGFKAKHPEIPVGLRIADTTALQQWLVTIGLGEGAPIPIHLLVDPAGKVQCVRAGAVKDTDLPAIRQVLGGS